jgi:hypothetical protein
MTDLAPRPQRPGDRITRRDGAPLAINRIIDERPDGTQVRAKDRFLQVIGFGEAFEVACDCAGLNLHHTRRNLKDGVTLAAFILAGRRTMDGMTGNEQALYDFSRAYTRALAAGATEHAALRNQAMRGGRVVTRRKTVEKVAPDGTILERTVTIDEETLAPSENMLRWHAERRWRPTYGARVDVHVHEGTDDEIEMDETDRLALLEAIAEAVLADGPIDVNEHGARSDAEPEPA